MKSIFKFYIFKLVVLSITMIFISFGALGKDVIYKCDDLYFKVENLQGGKKLFVWQNGQWKKKCTVGVELPDSFICIGGDWNKVVEKYVFDELTKQFELFFDDGSSSKFNCSIFKK